MTTTSPNIEKKSTSAVGLAKRVEGWKRQCLDWLPVLGSLMVIALLTGLVLMQMIPPAVINRSAPLTAFSAERALDHLQVIARAPHPTGSPENEQVRGYLVDQLRRLSLEPEVQTPQPAPASLPLLLPHSKPFSLLPRLYSAPSPR